MVLPYGQVYSMKGIDILIAQSTKEGIIICSKTKQLVSVNDIKNVFIIWLTIFMFLSFLIKLNSFPPANKQC